MNDYVKAATLDELADPARTTVEIDERIVALFHVGGEYFALDDVCTHDDGPLSDGELIDHTIACPRHGAKFDIRTGAALTMPATRPTQAHDVEVRADGVYVRLRTLSKSPVPSLAAVASTMPEHETKPVAPPISETPAEPVAVSEDEIREALKTVIDPELFVNIVDLGLIYNVTVSDQDDGKKHVVVEMTMTSPACPAGPQLLQGSKDALGRVTGIGSTEVKLVMVPPWTPDRMTEAARDQLGIF